MGKKKLFQVAWDISDQEILGKEIRALEIAMKELGVPGELITPENYKEIFLKDFEV